MQGLMEELTELSRRNDELMTAKNADLVVIRDLEKYELAKTVKRSQRFVFTCADTGPVLLMIWVHAETSQLFLQPPPRTDDNFPMSPDGAVLDIHVTAFVSAVDSLLTAGRSNYPTRVLAPLKGREGGCLIRRTAQMVVRPRQSSVDERTDGRGTTRQSRKHRMMRGMN